MAAQASARAGGAAAGWQLSAAGRAWARGGVGVPRAAGRGVDAPDGVVLLRATSYSFDRSPRQAGRGPVSVFDEDRKLICSRSPNVDA